MISRLRNGQKKQPGIRFNGVFLSKLHFELPQLKPEEFEYKLSIKDTFKIEGKTLIFTLAIRLYEKFELELSGVFETIEGEENFDLEKFADVNAPALLMPYERELISNITSRTPLPHLLLPPINIIALKSKVVNKKSKTSNITKNPSN